MPNAHFFVICPYTYTVQHQAFIIERFHSIGLIYPILMLLLGLRRTHTVIKYHRLHVWRILFLSGSVMGRARVSFRQEQTKLCVKDMHRTSFRCTFSDNNYSAGIWAHEFFSYSIFYCFVLVCASRHYRRPRMFVHFTRNIL